jgi:DnaK suppressor protein
MATKTKSPSKSKPSGAARKAAKGSTRVTAKKAAAKPAKAAKTTAKKPAAKAPAKKPAAKAPAAKAAPKSAKSAPAKPAAKAAPAKAPAKALPKSSGKAVNPVPGMAEVAATPSASVLPPPKPAARPAQVVSAQDLATAHEYLLSRSASRSGEPVMVDGKSLLTEEQLLSMPDDEYMNAAQLAFFRYRLQQMERELLSNADETTEHLRETVIVPDPADRATIEEEHALELRTRDRERKLLKKVQSSLAQIDSGEYGFCEETGDPIGIPRLLARPTATLSLEAQQRREIKQKLFGD